MVEKLSKENILKYISQEEIMEKYLGISVNYKTKHRNPFRKDNHADCMFRKGYKYIFFADYARPEYGGDCFKICALYYGLTIPGDFYEVCRHINDDFLLGLDDGQQKEYKAIQRKEVERVHNTSEETYSDIKVRVRPFSDYDLLYFSKYYITEEDLKRFNVYRADTVWINGDIFYHYQEKDLCFVYFFEETNTFKIYKPYGTYDKWRCNSLDIIGYKQLPKEGDILFLTKSMKDVIVLSKLGYSAISLQGEGNFLSEKLTAELKKRFKRIIVFYDNDEAGVKNSIRLTTTHNLEYFNIPKQFNVKDPSDFVEMYNPDELDNLIKNRING